MFKEIAKSGKSALGPSILLIVFMYVFYILWGIAEILLGVHAIPLVKHLILWGITGYCAWVIVARYIIEYEFTARSNEFTVMRITTKKIKPIISIKYENIIAIYSAEEADSLKEYSFSKRSNLKRAHQTGQDIHIVYRFNSQTCLMTLCVSRNMLITIRNNIQSKKEQNQI